jgi:ABC-type dipeptide/oligopeptide/nickel transport system permease component
MFRYALRRLLWSIPTLLATSLVLFLVTTLAPEPPAPPQPDPAMLDLFRQARRARFLDLPSFFNWRPEDVRSRAQDALAHIAAADADHAQAERDLRHLGGAALPYVLPRLEALPPDGRRRVVMALAPIAERMGFEGGRARAALAEPDTAALFWTRLWDNRALDFTRPTVNRAVARLIEHGSDSRERELAAVDTFALQALVRGMRATADRGTLERLTRLAHHAAERGPVIDADATDEQVRRAVADWREWWFVYSTDFVEIDGIERSVAVVTNTRFGRWLRRIASGELGVSAIDGEPIAQKLAARAPITLLVCALAVLVSWAIAIPIAVIGAWRRGGPFDVVTSGLLFLLYAAPTFAVAEILRQLTPPEPASSARIGFAVAALAAGSVATLSRWQRAAMLDVVRQDFVRTAYAKGVPGWRVLVVHALRNALLPTVTLAATHLPVLLGGAMIVEEVFALPGAGFETLRAIRSHDSPWLMAVLLAAAGSVTLGLVLSDVVYGLLDPRTREVLARSGGEPSA